MIRLKLIRDHAVDSRVIDLTGQKFGHVAALEYGGTHKSHGAAWLVRCDCGHTWLVSSSSLRQGHVKSCARAGCPYRSVLKHGHARRGEMSHEYSIWTAMKARCLNPNTVAYPRYGGRGITIYPRWAASFEAFLADMGSRPSPQHSIDRIDNKGNYEPGNVRWATRKEQARNKHSSVLLTWHSQTRSLAEWAEVSGLSYKALQHRRQRGWSVERTLTIPVRLPRAVNVR